LVLVIITKKPATISVTKLIRLVFQNFSLDRSNLGTCNTSDRLKDIIQKNEDKWDLLVQTLWDFRENIEENRKRGAKDIGRTETEFAFYNILTSEITKQTSDQAVDEPTHKRIIELVKRLVAMMDEATSIVGFFDKWDERKRVRKNIKRAILDDITTGRF